MRQKRGVLREQTARPADLAMDRAEIEAVFDNISTHAASKVKLELSEQMVDALRRLTKLAQLERHDRALRDGMWDLAKPFILSALKAEGDAATTSSGESDDDALAASALRLGVIVAFLEENDQVVEELCAPLVDFITYNAYKEALAESVATALDVLSMCIAWKPENAALQEIARRVVEEVEPDKDIEAVWESYLVFLSIATVIVKKAAGDSLVAKATTVYKLALSGDRRVDVLSAGLVGVGIYRERLNTLVEPYWGTVVTTSGHATAPTLGELRKLLRTLESHPAVPEPEKLNMSGMHQENPYFKRRIFVSMDVETFHGQAVLALLKDFVGGAVMWYIANVEGLGAALGLNESHVEQEATKEQMEAKRVNREKERGAARDHKQHALGTADE